MISLRCLVLINETNMRLDLKDGELFFLVIVTVC